MFFVFFFFFKQKTAYEMLRSLVGSEMCIRDRYQRRVRVYLVWKGTEMEIRHFAHGTCPLTGPQIPLLCVNIHEHAYCLDYPSTDDGLERYVRNCLLYTSDAADEEDSVDLGGRRIIKKKKHNNNI
eukprot:TRINITY_DN27991_c0_g1_i2.p1 TRINITY_DN27991_c0_g1~~TRINITY_DN27991_c0_g1_i2.p1  ORF type:complete len:126 (+),score=50.03 TRINITY_DN27991_c0_g1_i2:102-479(+)